MGLRFHVGGETERVGQKLPQEQERVMHAGERSARGVTHVGFSDFIPGRRLGAKASRK